MQALPRQLSKDVLHTLICTGSHPPAGIRVPATSSVVPPPVPPPHTCRHAALSGFATPRSFFPQRVTLSPAFRAGTHVLVVSFLTSPPSLSHLLPDEYVLRCQLKKEKKKRFRQRHCFIFCRRRRQTKPACHPSRLAPAAALIRGNRNNCTQFSNNLDWLVSKLERLESSSGTPVVTLKHLFRRTTVLKDKSHHRLPAS